jgi:hypothetical protein
MVDAVTAQLSKPGKGLPGSLLPIYDFPQAAALARQALPKPLQGHRGGPTEKKLI